MTLKKYKNVVVLIKSQFLSIITHETHRAGILHNKFHHDPIKA